MSSRGLSLAAQARVRDAVAPEGRVLRVRPLHGGISSTVHLVHVLGEAGTRRAVVVRRYGAYAQEHDPGACEREFRVLEMLSKRGLPVPRPILLDAVGAEFGAPTVVMSRVPGRPLLAPRDISVYVRQLAVALVGVHACPVDGLEFLPDQRTYVDRAFEAKFEQLDDPLQVAVWREASRLWPMLGEPRRALVHGDYWPGNILFRRGRLVGVVDWEQTRLGEPTKDVATCRGDLSVLFGMAAADAFLAAYRQCGGRIHDLRFWDLLISTWAVREIEEWSSVYPVLGRPELTAAIANQRIRVFAESALESS